MRYLVILLAIVVGFAPAAGARKHCDRLHHTDTVIRVVPLMGILRRRR